MKRRRQRQRCSRIHAQVRSKIEESGVGNRWEFDVKRLFDRTNYMAERCRDLYVAAEALGHFHNILGNELKAVTGDSAGINRVTKQVEALVRPPAAPLSLHRVSALCSAQRRAWFPAVLR
jgi:hypothetical protein